MKYHADNDSLRLLNNLRIRCIHDDPQGVMWVGTLEGLIRLDLRKRYINYFVLVPDAFDRMANEIRSICADRHGMLWLGTFDGLYRFNPTDNSFVRYETRSRKLPNDTYNNPVNALYIPENTPDLPVRRKFQRPGRPRHPASRAAARHPPRGRRRTYGTTT